MYSPQKMDWSKWKIRTPMDLLGAAFMLGFALLFVKCSAGEISLLVNPGYSIAHVYKVGRSNKLEMMTHYAYFVKGERYTGGQAWDEKTRVGDRYVVKYGEFEPIGSSLLDVPVPYSIQQDTGRVWQLFLRKNNLY